MTVHLVTNWNKLKIRRGEKSYREKREIVQNKL